VDFALVSGNTAGGFGKGGGLDLTANAQGSGSATGIVFSSFSGNTAENGGGGEADATSSGSGAANLFISSDATGNTAHSTGGGIDVELNATSSGSANLSMSGGNLSNNSGEGGGLSLGMSTSSSGAVTATLNRLTIANNIGSGALVEAGSNGTGAASVSIANTQVTGNNSDVGGGGIDALLTSTQGPTSLSISNSTISGNTASVANFADGGGLFINAQTRGPATTPSINIALTNSTVEGNIAGFRGGGLGLFLDNRANGGAITAAITGSTFDGNTALAGGAINSSEQAFAGTSATLTVTNSTLFANSAVLGGGLDNSTNGSGTTGATLLSDTIAFNQASSFGGGVEGDGISVRSSIVADNVAPFGPDVDGVFISLVHNLIGQTDGSSGFGGSDLTGTAASPLDPVFGDFGDHGGPTQTLSVLAGSPAIGNGDPAGPAFDQRGVFRSATAPTIGAFEFTGE
jgi:hypothetical protein